MLADPWLADPCKGRFVTLLAALLRRNWGGLTEKCEFRAQSLVFPPNNRATRAPRAGLHVMPQSAKQSRAQPPPGRPRCIKKTRTSDGGHDRTEIGIPWHYPARTCRAG